MSADRGPAATRQALLATSRRLDRVDRGIGLLRRKREALVAELFRLAKPATALRQEIELRAEAAWPALLDALGTDGEAGLRALGWPPRELEAGIRSGRVWGMPVAEILERSPARRTLAARGTPPGAASGAAIGAATAFEELVEALLTAADREALLRRIGEALARTSRQVNTLERRVGPALAERVRTMRRVLDEREREEHVRLDRLRGRGRPVA